MTSFPDTKNGRYSVLIMAANRHGIENPVARLGNATHKCIVPIAGIPMIDRVLKILAAWGKARRVLISIEDEAVLQQAPYAAELLNAGAIETVKSGLSLTDSVLAASETLSEDDYPLLITTGDNVMHTPEVLERFTTGVAAETGDLGAALTARSTVEAAYPDKAEKVGYLRFAEGEYSNCNIYLLTSPRHLDVVRIMRDGGQFRHSLKRIYRAFGLATMLKYKFGKARISDIRKRIEREYGLRMAVIYLDIATAPLDVDTPVTFAIAEAILKDREKAEA